MKKTNRTNRMTKVMAGTFAALMMMTTASSLAASADFVNVNAVVSANTQALLNSDAAQEYVVKTSIKLGMTAIEEYVPGGKFLAPILGDLLGACGIVPKETSLDDVNNNVNEMRAEINKKLDDLDKSLKKSTTDILNKIKNQTYISGLGSELDTLHTAAEGIGDQINALNSDKNLTPEERAVEIAYLIGSNADWNTNGKAVFTIKKIGNSLAGKSFADMGGRNMYQVVYDNSVPDAMFSGEAYDLAAPYIDRVMLEYFYAYSVAAQCFESAEKVSKLTPEQVNSLSEKTKHKYYACAACTSVVENEIGKISDQIFNATRTDSVVSAYASFNYKKANHRNIFVNMGKSDPIVISTKVKETAFKLGETNDSDASKARFANAKEKINKALSENVISGTQIQELEKYVRNTYPSMTFSSFLKYVGIDTSNFENDKNKRFSTSNKVETNDFYDKGEHIDTAGFDTFCHWMTDGQQTECFYDYFKGKISLKEYQKLTEGCDVCRVNTHNLITEVHNIYYSHGYTYTYYTYRLKEYDPILLTFENGTLEKAPSTAAEMV